MVVLWDVASGQVKAALEGHISTTGAIVVVSSVVFSPDGTILASGGWDRTVRLWDVASGQEKASLRRHADNVTSVAFSPDGATLASGQRDGRVVLWDVVSGQEKATLQGHGDGVNAVAFSPDGTTLASGQRDGRVVLWDVASGQEKATLQGHTDWVNTVAFSPDGATLASGSSDGTGLMWDMSPYLAPSPPVPTVVEAAFQERLVVRRLEPNTPNPFNIATRIPYRLAGAGPVLLEIYNTLGQRVRTLVDEDQPAGVYQVLWDARGQEGTTVSTGVYLARLHYRGGIETGRLLYLK